MDYIYRSGKMKEKLMEIFKDKNVGDLYFDEAMKNHTTFKIGGPVDLLIDTKNEDQIVEAIKLCRDNGINYLVMGNGSNLLVKDTGIRGVVIKIASGFNKVEIDGDVLKVEAGALLSTIAKKALKASLEGFEFASGIPGAIGGAVTMNAGAYGGEMKDVVIRVKALNQDNQVVFIDGKDMDFRYRASKVVDENLIVLGADIRLREGNYDEIKARLDDLTEKRTSKQPLELASAGSTFKRPTGYFAGKLIDDSGLRGFKYRNAQVSEKHCGFIVNVGGANFEEITTLIGMVQKIVYDNYKVELETEVKIIGD